MLFVCLILSGLWKIQHMLIRKLYLCSAPSGTYGQKLKSIISELIPNTAHSYCQLRPARPPSSQSPRKIDSQQNLLVPGEPLLVLLCGCLSKPLIRSGTGNWIYCVD